MPGRFALMGSYGIDEKRSGRLSSGAARHAPRIDTEALHHFAQKDELALRLGHKTHGGLSFRFMTRQGRTIIGALHRTLM
jgi:hypothetical protein